VVVVVVVVKAVADLFPSFTNVVGTLLEARLWDFQRFKHTRVAPADDREKHHGAGGAAPGVDAPVAHQTV
jgi:hypothetical protein